MNAPPQILRARFVIPVARPVIENGAIRIDDGRITAVGRSNEIAKTPSTLVTEFGDAALLPAFVNAHTHLELSALAGTVPPSPDFTSWLRRLIHESSLRLATSRQIEESAQRGVRESLHAGTATVGDITRHPALTRPALGRSRLRGVSFGEVTAIGTRRVQLEARIGAALAGPACGSVRIGISPHSPYSLEPHGLRRCADAARAADAPVCMHLAETTDEALFTRGRDGPFADFLRAIGAWDDDIPSCGVDPVALSESVGLLTPTTLLAHANYLTSQDVARLANARANVAYCPRTHAAFGHPPHPVRELLDAGVNVCIGTDSRASNPSLSVLDEIRFLRAMRPDLDPPTLFRMATMNGAAALGLGGQTGQLTSGFAADVAVVPLPRTQLRTWESLLDGAEPPSALFINGLAQPLTDR